MFDTSIIDRESENILHPNDTSEDAISIFSISGHPLKAKSPIDFTDDGISMCVNDEQLLKALFPINFIVGGITTSSSDVKPLNT